jgi:choline dehydrogenase-like flavoprotein
MTSRLLAIFDLTIFFSETRTAKGVEFISQGRTYYVTAQREVILSAGSIESPKLLMLSGIGPAEHLQQLGVKVIKDLPVGKTMYDHIGVLGPIFTVDRPIDQIVSFESIANLQNMALFWSGKGPFTTNGVESLLYMRTNLSSIDDVSVPDIEVMQSMVSMSFDTTLASRRAFRLTDTTYDSVYKPLQNKRTFQYLVINIHPRSKGYMKLNVTNPQGHPLFYANFLDDDRDLESLVLGIREMIRITSQKPFQELGVKIHEAQVPGCEGLTFNTDEYWRCYVRHMTTALHHQVSVDMQFCLNMY